MPTIVRIRRDFQNAMTGARSVFAFCLHPAGIHTQSGVEAAFLQAFKNWEGLLEETFIAFMCSRLAADGATIPCHVAAPNDDVARNLLYQGRQFIEWTDPEVVRERARCLFSIASRIESAINPVIGQLREMRYVRNAIAHASPQASRKFKDLVQRLFGGAPAIQRPAELLIHATPNNPNITMFDSYVTALEIAASNITG